MLHAAFVRSTVAHGQLRGVDIERGQGTARSRRRAHRRGPEPGAASDVADDDGPDGPAERSARWRTPTSATWATRSRMVVAENRYMAEDAAELVSRGHRTAAARVEAARRWTAPGWSTRAARQPRGRDPGRGIPGLDAPSRTPARLHRDFSQHRYVCVPMETRGPGRPVGPGQRAAHAGLATQGLHEFRAICSRILALPEARIRVIMGDVGGGFGQKMFPMREDIAVVLAARRLGPAGEVDRGPQREPAQRRARPRGAMTVSAATDDDGYSPGCGPSRWRTSAPTRPRATADRRGRIADLPRALPDPRARCLRGQGRLHQDVRPLRVPGPVDDGDGRPGSRWSTCRAAPGHRSARAAQAERDQPGGTAVHHRHRYGLRQREPRGDAWSRRPS